MLTWKYPSRLTQGWEHIVIIRPNSTNKTPADIELTNWRQLSVMFVFTSKSSP